MAREYKPDNIILPMIDFKKIIGYAHMSREFNPVLYWKTAVLAFIILSVTGGIIDGLIALEVRQNLNARQVTEERGEIVVDVGRLNEAVEAIKVRENKLDENLARQVPPDPSKRK